MDMILGLDSDVNNALLAFPPSDANKPLSIGDTRASSVSHPATKVVTPPSSSRRRSTASDNSADDSTDNSTTTSMSFGCCLNVPLAISLASSTNNGQHGHHIYETLQALLLQHSFLAETSVIALLPCCWNDPKGSITKGTVKASSTKITKGTAAAPAAKTTAPVAKTTAPAAKTTPTKAAKTTAAAKAKTTTAKAAKSAAPAKAKTTTAAKAKTTAAKA
ncbi:hypothetical protein K438DRAFT_1989244 [Mycena galopus ATCC 62051]|nr:hypothetical protein K438DRAFT_1989244 [Mycena galopus ATCC 62051]